MANLQIKNVPEELHEQVRQRAEEQGMTVRDYLLELIREDQVLPTMHEWLDRVNAIRPDDLPPINSAELIAEVRAEHEADLERKFKPPDRGS